MIRLGILGCSEIAFRRFMPAAKNVDGLEVVCVAEEYAPEKLKEFCDTYQIDGVGSFDEIIESDDIDAVYVPQPPALHHRYAKKALECGKHVLIEKPSTTCYDDTLELVELAKKNGLALHENYMFRYHTQIGQILDLIEEGRIGDVRLFRADFGFPMRPKNDFRFNKDLGGGALLDACGYTVKLAQILLGETAKVDTACMNGLEGFDVDMYGSATLSNDSGVVCQIGYGMDCGYRCSLDVWGSTGQIYTNRIFTAPPDYEPTVTIRTNDGEENISLKPYSHFEKSIEEFVAEIKDASKRDAMYSSILHQSKLIEDIRSKNVKDE